MEKKLKGVDKRVKGFYAAWSPLKDITLEAWTTCIAPVKKVDRRIKHG